MRLSNLFYYNELFIIDICLYIFLSYHRYKIKTSLKRHNCKVKIRRLKRSSHGSVFCWRGFSNLIFAKKRATQHIPPGANHDTSTVGQQRSNLTFICEAWVIVWWSEGPLGHPLPCRNMKPACSQLQPPSACSSVQSDPIIGPSSPPRGLQHVPGQLSKKEDPGIVCLCSGPIPARWAAPAGSDLGDAAAPISL